MSKYVKVNHAEKVCDNCKITFKPTMKVQRFCKPECNSTYRRNTLLRSYRNSENYRLEHRNRLLKNRFGISSEDYDVMFLNQRGLCKICGTHQSEVTRRFAVDHNHLTGEVRGLLCVPCNTAIGALRDSPELLEVAALYLRRSGKL